MTTDPTPAATARELLARALLAPTGVPWERTEAYTQQTYRDEADAILAALPDGWTLAAAEAPGRVAALEAALLDIGTERDMAHAYYPTLERHLREHGCTHNFADVAEANGTLAAPAPTPSDPVAR